jgi:hypothetical protein
MSSWAMILDGERKLTIAVRPAIGQQPRKITKIVSLNGNGFAVLTPYHKARSGFLFKMPVDPKILRTPGKFTVSIDQAVGFTADDRVKLSYHTDGFAQFSSEAPGRIISGRDPVTGEPKGLGLFARPLKTPVWSGPSVGVTVWGIDEFEEVEDGDRPVIVFEPADFYYRGCTPSEANAWFLSMYAFPVNIIPPVRWHHEDAVVDVALEGLSGPLVSVVQLKVVHLRREKVFLGLFVNRLVTHFPSESGWNISGPGDYTIERKGHVLIASYPRDGIPVLGRPSLDRTSPVVTPETSEG